MFEGKTVVLGVTGGIAVYKALDVISKLRKKNINVHVIMTKSATEFVTPLSFQSLSQNMVVTDMFAEPKAWEIQHISLAKKADVMAIVPATANIIGKVANGIADDMLSTTIMATKAPVIFAPAMNTNMWENEIVQNNVKVLKKYGYKFINPDSGRLACGDTGAGKLQDTEVIYECILKEIYDKKDLKGKKVLITAGPTEEPIDPVRFITNKSSGKMGYAIAEECSFRGAEVILITGNTKLKPPVDVKVEHVSTNKEMLDAVLKYYDDVDIVIKSAAVADFKAKDYSPQKIKKKDDIFSLELVKNTDILKTLGEKKSHQILVGFAAESCDLIKNAQTKIKNKNLDIIVANNILSKNAGFEVDTNKVTFLLKSGKVIDLPLMDKREVAEKLLDLIIEEYIKKEA